MKYRSDNKIIEKALNKTWYITILFFVIAIGLMILGLYYAGNYKINWLFPTSIIGSFVISAIPTTILLNYWFKYWILKVDNPYEFFRRAIRLNLIFPSTAKRIAKKLGVDIINNTYESTPYKDLPEILINKKVLLSNSSVTIENQAFDWNDIESFELSPYYSSQGLFGPTLDLVLKFKSHETLEFPLRVSKPFEFEYEMDKYLENSKKLEKCS